MYFKYVYVFFIDPKMHGFRWVYDNGTTNEQFCQRKRPF